MKRPKLGLRFGEAAKAISKQLGVEPAPVCRIGRGRITVKYRQLGASSWSEAQRVEHAFQTAAVARSLLAADPRRLMRRRASRAVVVIYEDATLAYGCDIDARWECVVPVSADDRR